MASTPALLNLAIPLIGMQVSRKIPFDDPQVLMGMRLAYIVSALLCLAAYYVASLKIKKRDDTTVLKYVEPKAPMSQEPGALVTTTNRDYDLGQCSQGVRGVLFGIAMMAFLHLYMKYDAPLFLQSIMPLKAVFDNKVIKIHLLGKPATGDLKRPFKAGGLMAGNEAQTDAKAIKDAEKAAAKTTKKEL